MRGRLAAWLPAIAWAGVIFHLSSQPAVPAPEIPGIDKALHFAAYAVLAWLLAFAAHRSRLPLAVAVVLGLLYGVTDEIHQMYVPGRSADLLDWVADAAGIATATFLYARRLARRAPAPAGGARSDAPFLRA